ncbi:MAG: 1-acyl-sn-glycerol-3-phosphate acyltransferase [Mycobacteriaceae bacterium]|nr:1-acyl-sn-glycerol-3-phosphate acyltransferase [Mycobacteriaceae bacterium]
MEPVYGTAIRVARLLWRLQGLTFAVTGVENVPRSGGAVVAINHTSYIDFLPAGLATRQRRRRIRYMLKAEMQDVRLVDFLIRRTRCIPVDRRAGGAAYAEAVRKLREGELVGVYPEATISRSFELKEFKSGAARMALEAEVPILPMIVWGAHRMWTKDHPRSLGRNKIPITVAVGRPLPPHGSVTELDRRLRQAMTDTLRKVQETYPHPAGAYWVPKRLGGSAPSPAEAARRDEIEMAERARRSAKRA